MNYRLELVYEDSFGTLLAFPKESGLGHKPARSKRKNSPTREEMLDRMDRSEAQEYCDKNKEHICYRSTKRNGELTAYQVRELLERGFSLASTFRLAEFIVETGLKTVPKAATWRGQEEVSRVLLPEVRELENRLAKVDRIKDAADRREDEWAVGLAMAIVNGD